MLVIYACDVGSIRLGNFAWARLVYARDRRDPSGGKSIDECARWINGDLADLTRTVAIGMECPTYLCIPNFSERLGCGRPNESSRSTYATAGGYVATLGLQQFAYLLSQLERGSRSPIVNWRDWTPDSTKDILLWEAFVSGEVVHANTSDHLRDAATAVVGFAKILDNGKPSTALGDSGESVLSLMGSAVLWAGWSNDVSRWIHADMLVVKPTEQFAGDIPEYTV